MFGLAGATVLVRDLEVSALAHPIPGTDLLIGLDLLLDCRLFVDGPARTFTFDF